MDPIRWQPDRSEPKPAWPMPSLMMAMGRGLMGRCPSCGIGRVFDGFLRVVQECEHCHAPLGLARADDAPPYFTILIVGHIVIPAMLIMQKMDDPSNLSDLAGLGRLAAAKQVKREHLPAAFDLAKRHSEKPK